MKRSYLAFWMLLAFLACAAPTNQTEEIFQQRLKPLQQKYAPDLTLNVFDFSLEKENGIWVLRGETTVPEARQAVEQMVDSLLSDADVRKEVVLLPHPQLGDSNYAIVRVAVANLREEPRHSAQLVDQAIMGSILRLLKNRDGWYLVQTGYGYLGWMRKESFVRTDRQGVQDWRNGQLVRVTALFTQIFQQPSEQSTPVANAVMNVFLQKIGNQRSWVNVRLPDGREGFIRKTDITENVNHYPIGDELREAIVKTAYRMMGVPYLWGGNSSVGSDCSGFTRTVFMANGIPLPRDARQQAMVGWEVKPEKDFSNLLPGDLLFFGTDDRITHVAISLGGTEYIHQSGDVHLNSLNPHSKIFSAYRFNTLKKIKRVLPE
ncbi:MAG: C40 family peptidase [Calditrichaeota bacterium]|nr:C40 family peptidase [Calditrichota bacterium]